MRPEFWVLSRMRDIYLLMTPGLGLRESLTRHPSNVYNQPLGEIWAIQSLHHFPVWLRAAWPSSGDWDCIFLRPMVLTWARVYYHVSWVQQTMRRAWVRGIQTTLHSHQGRECQLSVYHKTALTPWTGIKMSHAAWISLMLADVA